MLPAIHKPHNMANKKTAPHQGGFLLSIVWLSEIYLTIVISSTICLAFEYLSITQST